MVTATKGKNKMNQRLRLKELKHGLATKLGLEVRCHICHRTTYKGGMVFHHLWYVLGELISGHFPSSPKGRIEYHLYLQTVFDREGRAVGFRYMCQACHSTVSRIRRIKDNDRIRRLFDVVLETQWYSAKEMKVFFEAGKK